MIPRFTFPNITKLWTIFSICFRDAVSPFRTHSTPLECGRVDTPFSIDIALRWSVVFSQGSKDCAKLAKNT